MTDWTRYLKCDVCMALQGEPCRPRSSGGPESLTVIDLERPHRSRKPSGAPRKVAPQSPRKSTPVPQRRAAKKTANTADAWRALADKRRSK